jgi:FMN phosphatase YigB (HAD superfamily)
MPASSTSASSITRIALGGARRAGVIVLFDLDDTLVVTQPRFDGANAVILPLIASEAGVEASVVRTRYLEIRKIKDAAGFSTAHYGQAYLEAYRALVKSPTAPTEKRILSVAAAVWTPPYETHAGAAGAVATIAANPAVGGIFILTLGNRAVQMAKINSLPGATRVAMSAAYVVGAKNETTLRRVLGGIDPASAIMIGNSRTSDIAPAQACGMAAVLVEAGGWEHDQAQVNTSATFFRSVPTISGAPGAVASLIAAINRR